MAAERWHGQNQDTARMGEASEIARWEDLNYMTTTSNGNTKTGHGRTDGWRNASHPRRPPVRQRRNLPAPSVFGFVQVLLLAVILCIPPTAAVFITFDNCLSPDIVNSNNPKNLQFVPLYVWATFNSSDPSHNINVTAYGNVTGIATEEPLPPVNDPQWMDPNKTTGKIPDTGGQGAQEKFTTFTTKFNVLDYTPYNPAAVRLCNSSSLTQCPLAPVFNFSGNE